MRLWHEVWLPACWMQSCDTDVKWPSSTCCWTTERTQPSCPGMIRIWRLQIEGKLIQRHSVSSWKEKVSNKKRCCCFIQSSGTELFLVHLLTTPEYFLVNKLWVFAELRKIVSQNCGFNVESIKPVSYVYISYCWFRLFILNKNEVH